MTSMGHAIWTVVLFVVFIGIIFWAYSSHRKKDFDEAARLAVDDEKPGESRQNAQDQTKAD